MEIGAGEDGVEETPGEPDLVRRLGLDDDLFATGDGLSESLQAQVSGAGWADVADGAEGEVVTWVDVAPEQAGHVVNRLWAWMGMVLVHFPHVMEVLRPCWYRHPASVQTLLDVRAAWVLAYRHSPSSLSALEWSRVHLPHLEQMLTRDLGQCSSVRHDPKRVPLPPLDEGVASYLRWWTQDRVTDTEPSAPSRRR